MFVVVVSCGGGGYFASGTEPCAPKEIWHRIKHMIIIIITLLAFLQLVAKLLESWGDTVFTVFFRLQGANCCVRLSERLCTSHPCQCE